MCGLKSGVCFLLDNEIVTNTNAARKISDLTVHEILVIFYQKKANLVGLLNTIYNGKKNIDSVHFQHFSHFYHFYIKLCI